MIALCKALLLFLACAVPLGAVGFPWTVGPTGRYLVDLAGTPVLLHADTPWGLVVALTREETLRYLDDRQARGFNALIVNALEHSSYEVASWSDAPKNRAGDAPFLVPGDFGTPNEKYFAHLDWVLAQAEARGMTLLLTPAYLSHPTSIGHGWNREYLENGVDKCRDYGRYLGRRYRERKNIIWVMFGDRDPDDTEPMVHAMAEGIREMAPAHLMTAHFQRGHSARALTQASWLSLNVAYTTDVVHTQCLEEYARTPPMPFLLFEARYENEWRSTVADQRRQAYTALLCGAMGQALGNLPLWKFDTGWQAAMDSPATRHMAHVRALFLSRAWHELVPDVERTVVYARGAGAKFVPGARTRNGETVLVYLPAGTPTVRIDMTKISGERVRAWWYNPRDGTAALINDYRASAMQKFTPPDKEDWVLVLDDVAKRFPVPGRLRPAAQPKAD